MKTIVETRQFKGLPMEKLVGGPIDAAIDAQAKAAKASADFVQQVGRREEAAGAEKAKP